MLSSQNNQPSPIHRRQNSTPISSDFMAKASYSPAHFTPQQTAHRRGLSMDQAMQLQGHDLTPKQEQGTVSTNLGPQPQQNMRATQMLASSRPGSDEYFRNHSLGFESSWKEFQLSEGASSEMDMFIQQMTQPNRQEQEGQSNVAFSGLADPFTMPEPLIRSSTLPQTPHKKRILGMIQSKGRVFDTDRL